MKVSEIQELIKFISKSGVSEVEIEHKDFKINIKTPPYRKGRGAEPVVPQQVVTHQMMPAQMQQAMPAQMPVATAPVTPAAPQEDENANYIEIKSPMIGTFYRKPSPDKDEFAKVGDSIGIGDTVCVIEAMKLFNEIESEVSGKIVKVLVDDTTPVEYDQVLFLIDPAG